MTDKFHPYMLENNMMHDELVYIAGPYRAKSASKLLDNIQKARTEALKWWKFGYTTICPHLNSAFMDGECNDENFLLGDLKLLALCDIIVVVEGWESSEGTRAEIVYAKSLNKLVMYATGQDEQSLYLYDKRR